jgi:hypothetical protein
MTERDPACCVASREADRPSRELDGKTRDEELEAGESPPAADDDDRTDRMVRLPGGTFEMGTDGDVGFEDDGEGPAREVDVDPFYVDRFAVTRPPHRGAALGEPFERVAVPFKRPLEADVSAADVRRLLGGKRAAPVNISPPGSSSDTCLAVCPGMCSTRISVSPADIVTPSLMGVTRTSLYILAFPYRRLFKFVLFIRGDTPLVVNLLASVDDGRQAPSSPVTSAKSSSCA